jgi:hypothetical protein
VRARGLWNARAGVKRLFVRQVPLSFQDNNLPLASPAGNDPYEASKASDCGAKKHKHHQGHPRTVFSLRL